MPSYDFRCAICDHMFEVARPAARAADGASCPQCSADAKRVFSPVGVVFKGSGFHNTDYRAKPSGEPKQDSSPKAGDTPPASCGTSDACASCPGASS